MVELTKEKVQELDLCQSCVKANVCMFYNNAHSLIKELEGHIDRKGKPMLRAGILICKFHLKEVKWEDE